MAGQVTLPGVGPVSKKALYIGGGVAAVVMGVLYLRKRKTAVTPAATDTSSSTDTSGTDTTGLDTSGGGFFTGGGGAGFPGGAVNMPTSNPQWFAQAMQALSGVVDQTALASALGKYLTGTAVTGDEEAIIDQAIAAAGEPPVAGPNGYPPAIRQSPPGGQTNPPITGRPIPSGPGMPPWQSGDPGRPVPQPVGPVTPPPRSIHGPEMF